MTFCLVFRLYVNYGFTNSKDILHKASIFLHVESIKTINLIVNFLLKIEKVVIYTFITNKNVRLSCDYSLVNS